MIIYLIENLINGKVYIGQTVKSLEERKFSHKQGSKYLNYSLYYAMRKYGFDNFNFSIIEKNIETQEALNEAEIYWINCYGSFKNPNIGYNETPGGDGLGSGKNHPMFGKYHSVKTKEKMSLIKIGKYCGENSPSFGRKKTNEEKDKMSLAKIGKKPHNYGKSKIDEETVKLICKEYNEENTSYRKLGITYNVSYSTIKKIVNKSKNKFDNFRINEIIIEKICKEYDKGNISCAKLGKIYNLSSSTINKIIIKNKQQQNSKGNIL